MSDLSISNQLAESQARPDRQERQLRAERRAHERSIQFHLLLNLGFALAATYVLKLDGPYYADGIAAGLFLVGCFLSLWSRRQLSNGDGRAVRMLFVVFAVFFLAAAASVVYFTYIAPPDMPLYEEEGMTRTFLNVSFTIGQLA